MLDPNRLIRCLCVIACVALFGAAGVEPAEAREEPEAVDRRPEWCWFPSKEEGREQARLELTFAGGASAALGPAADSLLISYLAERAFGFHKRLSLHIEDRNRVLLRFDVPQDVDIEKAVLALAFRNSKIALTQPFEIAIHEVTGRWTEESTTWTSQPDFEKEPRALFTVPAKAGAVRIDVTKLLADGRRPPNGWLLKAARPVKATRPAMPIGGARTARQTKLRQRLLEHLKPWAPTPAAAVAQAKQDKKLVCCVARASYRADVGNLAEDILLATALSHPAVQRLLNEHFVRTRAWFRGWYFTIPEDRSDDPLKPLGTSTGETRPLALVVANGAGGHVDTLGGIGTFDARLVYEFLLGALRIAGKRTAAAWPEEADDVEARYQRGVASFVAGDEAAAREAWAELPRESTWRLKTEAWEVWPERMRMYAAPRSLPYAVRGTSTETRLHEKHQAALETHAVTYLLGMQAQDGSWPLGDNAQPMWASGVTALCAWALLAVSDDVDEALRDRIDAALERATAWIEKRMRTVSAEREDSFGSAYMLDFLLARMERERRYKPLAQKAVAHLIAGQSEHGAWSYNREWGKRWRGGFGGWPKTDKGRYHSMNTGPALVALLRAKALGLAVDADALKRGREVLLDMRERPGVFTYTWPEPRNFNTDEKLNLGRAPCCEQALLELGATKRKDLELAISTFMKHRLDMRKVAKVTKGWTPPLAVSSYFYFFAYHHAARAIRALGGTKAKQRMAELSDDMLAIVEVDGTWVDWLGGGKAYGTAMALLVLDFAR